MGAKFMLGNEAIARGAAEAGVTVVSGYPGTPATEIVDNCAEYPGIYAEWATNEKHGFEVAMGASLNNQTFFFVFLVLSQFFTLITLGHFFGKTMSTGRDVDLGYGK